jgi:antitoxin YefM
MLIASISDFRKDIRKYLDKVCGDFETLLINRGNNQAVVVLSLEEYNAIMATQHELKSKKNEARLDAAIESLRKGEGQERSIKD